MAPKSKRRKNTNSSSKHVGRPSSNNSPNYVNITLCKDAMKKVDGHENQKEYPDMLLRGGCDWIITRIQAKLHALVNRLAITAAGCTCVLALLYTVRLY